MFVEWCALVAEVATIPTSNECGLIISAHRCATHAKQEAADGGCCLDEIGVT